MGNKGFTLIESLIVLSIVAIITSASIVLFNPQKNYFIHQIFLSQLQSDFYLAQQYAISHQQDVTVVFDLKQKRYYMRIKFDGPFIDRALPPSVTIQPGTLPLTFKFLIDGNVNQFGSFNIIIEEKIYKFTILLGKGRFYFVET